jgi:hypothetical protein
MKPNRKPRVLQNRQGATLPIVAVCMVMLLGCAAFAIDVGMLLDSRAEAQRAADAAALAGASALLDGHIRELSAAAQQAAATARAVEYAGLNTVRNTNVIPAEVGVNFPTNARIAATVTRSDIAPLFASIFGVNALRVQAVAHAMWYQGGGSDCIRPFGVPDTSSITLADVGTEVLIWRKDAQQMFPLFRQFSSGSNVRDAIKDQVCDPTVVMVGDQLSHNETSNNTAVSQGQVDQGIDYLFDLHLELGYGDLVYNPTLYGHLGYEGFNRPDWRGSPRVMNLILYDVDASTNTRFTVSGFMTVFLPRKVENAPQGDRLLHGIVLPHKAASGAGPCTPPNCSALSFNFRLVQ